MEHILPLELEPSDGERDCKRHVHECKQQLVMMCSSVGQCRWTLFLCFPPKGMKQ